MARHEEPKRSGSTPAGLSEPFDRARRAHAAAIYLRVSTDQQTTDNQEPDCVRLAEHQGWNVVEVYREQQSAVKKRPIFRRMMADARSGGFRFLIVWRLDRFGRSMQGNINDVLELESVGVSVVSVKEPWLAVDGSARNLLLAIFSWLAEEERRVLIERIRAGIARSRAEGKPCGRRPPVSREKVLAAVGSVRGGVPIRVAAREQGIGHVPVRKVLAFAAADAVRAGGGVRTISRKFQIRVDTIRGVIAGTSYLCKGPSVSRAANEGGTHEVYLPFAQARAIAHELRLRHRRQWISWSRGDSYRLDIPLRPWEFYRDEWQNWPDWLGYEPETRLPFTEARAFARSLGFHSPNEWRQWCREGKRPRTVPPDPWRAYPTEYRGFADWLGYPPRNCRGIKMLFADAREYVRSLGLGSAKDWYVWAASEKRLRSMPSNPEEAYPTEWAGWRDWLGHERIIMLPFSVARRQARRLGLRTSREWIAWTRSGKRPRNIPCKPENTYESCWRGFPDWLGYKPVKWLQFYRARRQVHELGLRSCAEWFRWATSDRRPKNVPSSPPKVYRPYWRGWRDWLGVTAGVALVAREQPRVRHRGLPPSM